MTSIDVSPPIRQYHLDLHLLNEMSQSHLSVFFRSQLIYLLEGPLNQRIDILALRLKFIDQTLQFVIFPFLSLQTDLEMVVSLHHHHTPVLLLLHPQITLGVFY